LDGQAGDLEDLPVGTHTVRMVATGALGHLGERSFPITLRADPDEAQVTISAGDPTLAGTYELRVSAGDPPVGSSYASGPERLELYLDGAPRRSRAPVRSRKLSADHLVASDDRSRLPLPARGERDCLRPRRECEHASSAEADTNDSHPAGRANMDGRGGAGSPQVVDCPAPDPSRPAGRDEAGELRIRFAEQ